MFIEDARARHIVLHFTYKKYTGAYSRTCQQSSQCNLREDWILIQRKQIRVKFESSTTDTAIFYIS